MNSTIECALPFAVRCLGSCHYHCRFHQLYVFLMLMNCHLHVVHHHAEVLNRKLIQVSLEHQDHTQRVRLLHLLFGVFFSRYCNFISIFQKSFEPRKFESIQIRASRITDKDSARKHVEKFSGSQST